MGPIARLKPGALFRLSECQRALGLTFQREDYRPLHRHEPDLHPEELGYLSAGRPGLWWPWDLTHAAMATRLKLSLLLAVVFCAPCSRDHASAPSLGWLPCRNPCEPVSDFLLPCPSLGDKWHSKVFFRPRRAASRSPPRSAPVRQTGTPRPSRTAGSLEGSARFARSRSRRPLLMSELGEVDVHPSCSRGAGSGRVSPGTESPRGSTRGWRTRRGGAFGGCRWSSRTGGARWAWVWCGKGRAT